MLTFKLAPAIAYGNTVVAKPSELTSMTAYKLCQILDKVGLPRGVINMVFGYGHTIGPILVGHADVPLVSFTGSTETGRKIALTAAPFFKKLSLEMGGKNAALVFDDVDLDRNMASIVRSCLFNSGEICLATSRLLVQEGVYARFVRKFIDVAK